MAGSLIQMAALTMETTGSTEAIPQEARRAAMLTAQSHTSGAKVGERAGEARLIFEAADVDRSEVSSAKRENPEVTRGGTILMGLNRP